MLKANERRQKILEILCVRRQETMENLAQVKALIQKYGADKLSGVQPEKYADLLHDAKAL